MATPSHRYAQLPHDFAEELQTFSQSSANFKIIKTSKTGPEPETPVAMGTRKLYVLDSSFNPPTLGHLGIVMSAINDDPSSFKHVLLSLAIQNADKTFKPATFEQRLSMMTILKDKIMAEFTDATNGSATTKSSNSSEADKPLRGLQVSVSLTKHPFFIDKSQDIAKSKEYGFPPWCQVHLIGFDTFTRLFMTQYYPPEHTLKPLQALFDHHEVRVTLRHGDKWGSQEDQRQYVENIADGKLEHDGGSREWAQKFTIVEGRNAKLVTSSTRAREAAKRDDVDTIKQMCGEDMAEWIASQKLYKDT